MRRGARFRAPGFPGLGMIEFVVIGVVGLHVAGGLKRERDGHLNSTFLQHAVYMIFS